MRQFITAAAVAAITILTISAQAQLSEEVGSINNAGEPRGGVPTVCSDPEIIALDDGVAENAYSGTAAVVSEVTIVQRFDSADFPAGLIDAACIGWVSLGPDSVNFDIVVFDDDGPGGAPGTELGAVPASATGLPGSGLPETVFDYDLSASGITLPASGNFYLGARWVPSEPNVFIAADETGATNIGAGQVFFDTGDPGDDWETLSSFFPNYSALIVRALAGEGEPPPAFPVSMMSNWALILMGLMLAAIAVTVLRLRF